MKVLILSDSHGYNQNMWQAMNIEKPYDAVVHCGDFGDDLEEIRYRAGAPVYAVKGNNDYFSDAPRVNLFELCGRKILVVHGDRDGAHSGCDRLIYKGLENGASIVMFGHTHCPYINTLEGITLINPGSLTYPRQDKHIPTYAVLNIENDGKYTAEIKYMC